MSVRLSVTRRYCVKTKKASGMISLPFGSPKTLVFRRQISSPNSKGFPPNGGFKEGSVEKFSDFYPRDAMLARVTAIATCPSVCPSVRPSVRHAPILCQNEKASGMISSSSGSPKTPVFRRQISSPNSKGFPANGGLKQGSVGKIQRFSTFKRQYLENGSRYGQSYY